MKVFHSLNLVFHEFSCIFQPTKINSCTCNEKNFHKTAMKEMIVFLINAGPQLTHTHTTFFNSFSFLNMVLTKEIALNGGNFGALHHQAIRIEQQHWHFPQPYNFPHFKEFSFSYVVWWSYCDCIVFMLDAGFLLFTMIYFLLRNFIQLKTGKIIMLHGIFIRKGLEITHKFKLHFILILSFSFFL